MVGGVHENQNQASVVLVHVPPHGAVWSGGVTIRVHLANMKRTCRQPYTVETPSRLYPFHQHHHSHHHHHHRVCSGYVLCEADTATELTMQETNVCGLYALGVSLCGTCEELILITRNDSIANHLLKRRPFRLLQHYFNM